MCTFCVQFVFVHSVYLLSTLIIFTITFEQWTDRNFKFGMHTHLAIPFRITPTSVIMWPMQKLLFRTVSIVFHNHILYKICIFSIYSRRGHWYLKSPEHERHRRTVYLVWTCIERRAVIADISQFWQFFMKSTKHTVTCIFKFYSSWTSVLWLVGWIM